MPLTGQGKKEALAALESRRAQSAKTKKIDNASLHAGSPMYFYCASCGVNHAVLPELYVTPPPKLCEECKALKDCGWLE